MGPPDNRALSGGERGKNEINPDGARRRGVLVMSENRTRTGQFAKGKSGNPSGRPRQAPDIKGLIQQNTVKAVKTIIDIMNDDDAPGKVRLAAAIAILDRALGKPETTSKVELSGRGEVKEYVCRWMTEDDVKKENVKKEGAVA